MRRAHREVISLGPSPAALAAERAAAALLPLLRAGAAADHLSRGSDFEVGLLRTPKFERLVIFCIEAGFASEY